MSRSFLNSGTLIIIFVPLLLLLLLYAVIPGFKKTGAGKNIPDLQHCFALIIAGVGYS
jgi:hypothetical protein